MDNIQTNPPSDNPFPTPPQSSSSVGIIAGAVVVILLLAGTTYYMTVISPSEKVDSLVAPPPQVQPEGVSASNGSSTDMSTTTQANVISALSSQSQSDEVGAIEKDIDATDIDSVMSYINNI